MTEYHKIDTVFKRDPTTKFKTLVFGEYSQDAFAYLANNDWLWTEKVDGTNIRVMINRDGKPTFGGKTDAASIPAPLVARLNERFLHQQERFAEMFTDGACLYGEGYGPKIQSGGHYRANQDFVLFDVRVGDWWLQRTDIEDVANKLNLDVVPIIGCGTLVKMVEWTQQGFQSQWGNFAAEGIVARPVVELQTRSGARIITKIKHKDFR